MFKVSCRCGNQTTVRLANAGLVIQCRHCGGKLHVPPMSVLRAHADRGEPAPAGAPEDTPDDQSDHNVPAAFIAHYCGEFGPTSRVSSSAWSHYVGLFVKAVEAILEGVSDSAGCELLVSCALLPQNNRLLLIETQPADVGKSWRQQLHEAIEQIDAPPVVDGPVGFLVYRSVNLPAVDRRGLQPFSRWQTEIERHGVDSALMRAVGIDRKTTKSRLSFIRWLRRLVSSDTNSSQSRGGLSPETYQEFGKWLERIDGYFSSTPIDQLKRYTRRRPHDLDYHAGLARRYEELQDWQGAILQYTTAIRLRPDFAQLYSRRASVHLLVGDRQHAFQDLNQAIALAPFESMFYESRSMIFADLEAFPQAEADLSSAHQLAPREPSYLLSRAGLRLTLDKRQEAIDDLQRVIHLDPNSGSAHAQLGWILQHQDTQLALDHLGRAISLVPEEIFPRVSRSLVYASQNKFELALQDCDVIIQMHPDSATGYGVRGHILQLEGEFTEAIKACDEAIERGLESPMVLLARGFSYAATDQLELALSDCETALSIDPDNPLACQLRGLLGIERGEFETAMEAFSRASEIAPNWTEPRQQLALLHRINEDPQAAIDEQSALVAQEPNNPAHYVNRAFAYTQLGDFEQARQDYDQACDLDPENEEILFLRGCFSMDRQNLDMALRDFDQVLTLAEEHDEARLRRAGILLQLNRYREALDDYKKLIAKYPDDPQAFTGRAVAHQMIGDEQAAAEDFDRLSRMVPEKSEETTIHSLQAKVSWLESQQRYEEAIAAAEEVIEFAPENPLGYELRAWIRWYTEQHVEALDDFTQIANMKPDDPSVLNSRGQVLAEMGEWGRALEDLDSAVSQSRERGQTQLLAYALNGRALALAGVGRMEESTRDYQESIHLCPGNSWAYYNRAVVMHQRGEHDTARELFQQALAATEPALSKRKRDRATAMLGS